MAVSRVRVYPDPVLKQTAAPVVRVDDDARGLAVDLIDTMRAHERCVGLAANQIGSLRRCVVVDVSGHARAVSCAGLIVLFDPVIARASGAEIGREGCLSIPDLLGDVRRATEVVVRGLDETGAERIVAADAFEARALQHEIDHLDGVLFLDRVVGPGDVYRRKR